MRRVQVFEQGVAPAVEHAHGADERERRSMSPAIGSTPSTPARPSSYRRRSRACGAQLVEAVELDEPDRGVDVGEMRAKPGADASSTTGAARRDATRSRGDAEVAPEPHPARKLVVVGRDRAAFAAGDVLHGIEAEAREIADRADHPAAIGGAESVRGVFDDAQPCSRAIAECVEVARKAGVVDGHHGSGPRRDQAGDVVEVERDRVGSDVAEDRAGAGREDGLRA